MAGLGRCEHPLKILIAISDRLRLQGRPHKTIRYAIMDGVKVTIRDIDDRGKVED